MPALKLNVPGTLTILIVALAWEVMVRSGAVAFDYLPPPSAILVAWVGLLQSGEMLTQTVHTLRSVLVGWFIASVIGIALGLLLGFSAPVRRYTQASLEVLRPLPVIAFLPLALLLFNFSLTTELILIIYASVWPVLINTMGGVMGIHARLFEVGRTFRLSRADTIRKILLPAALPAILVGARISMTLALVLAIVAEMVGNPNGLGYAVVRDQQALRPELMFADVIVIGLLGIVLNAVLVGAVAAFFPAASGRLREAG
jgi:ABC-type nitrate/sulfonate/bicarbonate transport system permease component